MTPTWQGGAAAGCWARRPTLTHDMVQYRPDRGAWRGVVGWDSFRTIVCRTHTEQAAGLQGAPGHGRLRVGGAFHRQQQSNDLASLVPGVAPYTVLLGLQGHAERAGRGEF